MKKLSMIFIGMLLICMCGCGSSAPKLTSESTPEEIFTESTSGFDEVVINDNGNGKLTVNFHLKENYNNETSTMSVILTHYVRFLENLFEYSDFTDVTSNIFIDTNQGKMNTMTFEVKETDFDPEKLRKADDVLGTFEDQCATYIIKPFFEKNINRAGVYCS